MLNFPYETRALRVEQPLGTFYVAVLPAELLLQVAFSDHTYATINPDGNGYHLEGTQRLTQDKRLSEIANYINRVDAAFPNSIIIAANHDLATGFDQGEVEDMASEHDEQSGIPHQSKAWTVEELEEGHYKLLIPTSERLAAVIDGQHRLFSFAKVDMQAIRSMDLLCSVFLDLPKSLQAQIFAVINSTQKRVDRSLTYELFGYNLADEAENYWTPDKLAVFFTRKLGTDQESPLRGRIVVAPKRDAKLQRLKLQADWHVSTAVVADGILRLFSGNPKRDSNVMRKGKANPRSSLESGSKDRSPMRSVFIEGNDALLYKMVLNYVKACTLVFWKDASNGSFIFRTIGVQAVFDILRKLAAKAYEDKNISVKYFTEKITPAKGIDFADEKFRNPSGSGRTLIRKTIEDAIGIGA